MKSFFKGLLILTVIGILVYAAYLFYVRFFSCCNCECDDLEDEEEYCKVAFADRVKAAAGRQLGKIK